jgi:hypothetical protein
VALGHRQNQQAESIGRVHHHGGHHGDGRTLLMVMVMVVVVVATTPLFGQIRSETYEVAAVGLRSTGRVTKPTRGGV